MNRRIGVFLSVLCALTPSTGVARADEPQWPKSPFKPQLVHVAEGADLLCGEYLNENRARFFQGHPGFSELAAPEQFDVVQPTNLMDLLNHPNADDRHEIYKGNWSGDGREQVVLAFRGGGSRPSLYRHFYEFIPLAEEWLDRYVEDLDNSSNDRDELEAVRLEFHKFVLERYRDSGRKDGWVTPGGEIGKPVSDAFKLNDSMRVRSFDGKLYVDVLVSISMETHRVLLSFGKDMTPSAQCVVQTRADLGSEPPFLSNGKVFLRADLAQSQMLGTESPCSFSRNYPHHTARLRQEMIFYDAMYQPWGDGGEHTMSWRHILRPNQYETGATDLSRTPGAYDPQQYFWSLESPFNRHAHSSMLSLVEDLESELQDYFLGDYEIDPETAGVWARSFAVAMRRIGSWNGDYLFSHRHEVEALESIFEGHAKSLDFLRQAIRNRLAYSRADLTKHLKNPSASDLNKALSLAVGAGASHQVLEELIDLGADGSDGDEPALVNAVDNLPALRLLLSFGFEPDVRNGFGKTPLMMAAHMYEEGAVAALLGNGADPNANTWKVLPNIVQQGEEPTTDCRYRGLKYRERTSLMYAAENASLEIIQFLLDAGADKSAIDTGRRGMMDYLALNRLLTPQDMDLAKELLSAD